MIFPRLNNDPIIFVEIRVFVYHHDLSSIDKINYKEFHAFRNHPESREGNSDKLMRLVDMAFGVVRFGLIVFSAQLELPRKATGSRRLIGIYAHRLSLG